MAWCSQPGAATGGAQLAAAGIKVQPAFWPQQPCGRLSIRQLGRCAPARHPLRAGCGFCAGRGTKAPSQAAGRGGKRVANTATTACEAHVGGIAHTLADMAHVARQPAWVCEQAPCAFLSTACGQQRRRLGRHRLAVHTPACHACLCAGRSTHCSPPPAQGQAGREHKWWQHVTPCQASTVRAAGGMVREFSRGKNTAEEGVLRSGQPIRHARRPTTGQPTALPPASLAVPASMPWPGLVQAAAPVLCMQRFSGKQLTWNAQAMPAATSEWKRACSQFGRGTNSPGFHAVKHACML